MFASADLTQSNEMRAAACVRLIAWNCHHGSLRARLAHLSALSPAIVFLQEFRPARTPAPMTPFATQRVNARKGVALGSLDPSHSVVKLRPRAGRGRGVVGAKVTGPASFIALGIWSQGPRYVDDVLQTVDAYRSILRAGPAVVMGDLNSGTSLARKRRTNNGHSRIVDALADLGLVSAYHAFHRVQHGHESHPTYRHLWKASNLWHIDFCFVPFSWVANLIRVDVLDGKEWTARSDHLPLVVDLRFADTIYSAKHAGWERAGSA
ncbi:MAG TPA: endonuclease/exonuclease/phosphatase family protein [Vicinamibacterales bacterium]|jgi:endonuclease/exonuclease/phosphatase family metal-dependent hydrolase|nr:endonuclease/exonuclease/phosphatase family protein [Vicinamibacterales bacterium]